MEIKKPINIDIELLIPNPTNPNVMTDKQLTKLCDQILEYGFTEPLMVGKIGGGKYEIISGHHRHKAAQQLGLKKLPCLVYDDWDEKKRQLVMLRMNIVKGKMNPQKFIELWDSYVTEYGENVAKDMMGFADEGTLDEIKKQVLKGLPKKVRNQVEEKLQQNETTSVEELTKVVSDIMADFGETVPCNFVHFTHGGKEHVMQRTDDELWGMLKKFYWACEAEGVDSLMAMKVLFKDWDTVVLRKQFPKRGEEEEEEGVTN